MLNGLGLFAGIGGLELGLERSGLVRSVCFVEKDPYCQKVLAKRFPDVPIWDDVATFDGRSWRGTVDVISGGDPCPIRSRAKAGAKTKHPDLSGFFLSIIGQCWPRWVVRENVPASDDVCFSESLERLGYGTIIIRINAASFTCQSRTRDFIVGCYQATKRSLRKMLSELEDGAGRCSPRLETKQICACLTTHPKRYDSRDNFIWDGQFRILDGDERIAIAGFPADWLDGLSKTRIAAMTGNAVVPQVAEYIGRLILRAISK